MICRRVWPRTAATAAASRADGEYGRAVAAARHGRGGRLELRAEWRQRRARCRRRVREVFLVLLSLCGRRVSWCWCWHGERLLGLEQLAEQLVQIVEALHHVALQFAVCVRYCCRHRCCPLTTCVDVAH